MRCSVRSMPARLSSPNVADALDDVVDVAVVDLAVEQRHLRVREARLRPAAEVHDDLDERRPIGQRVDGGDDLGREGREQGVEVVDRFRWRSADPTLTSIDFRC